MHFFKDGEKGDLQRQCIGGVGSAYRALSYRGNWEQNERNGYGTLTYVNGDTIEGHFEHGQPHGVHVYLFHSTAKKNRKGITVVKKRGARFVRGERIEWIDENSTIMKMVGIFQK
jgi:hypothetical protein